MRHWVQAQLRSNWIDVLAIPIIVSIMEAQVIFVVLTFTSPAFAEGELGRPFLSEISIILLALGLRWWAKGVRASVQHGTSENNERLLSVLGLLIAGGLVVGTPVLLVRTVLTLIFSSALVLWLWWRGMRQVTIVDDEQLVFAFRIGFVILLIVLVPAVVYLDASDSALGVLAQAIPIFFLSGLLGLSFTRIALIRRETARYTTNNTISGSTRNWLFVLTASWLVVVIAVFALQALSFQAVIVIVGLLWSGISIVLLWLVTLIFYLLTPVLYIISFLFVLLIRFFHVGRPSAPVYPPQRNNPIVHPQNFSPEALAAGRFVLLLVALIALFFIARSILRRRHTVRKEDEVEEIREGLSLRSIVQQRRVERHKPSLRQVPQLETLEPDSARAHYRELLQAMVSNNPALPRRPDETPTEYQARLLPFAQQALSEASQEEGMLSEQEILDVLTHDYNLERYGGKHLDAPQKNYLRTWVPRLVERLTRK